VEARVDRLCELNVIEQAVNVAQTTIMEAAWERGQEVTVHGWVYRLANGLVRHLHMDLHNQDEIDVARSRSIDRLLSR
jgi:carbonic anhydrase